MASGLIQGYIAINQSYFPVDTKNVNHDAYCKFGDWPKNPNLRVLISELYLWEGTTEWVVQFKVLTAESDFSQAYFNTLVNGSSAGIATGILEITIGDSTSGNKYLVMPKRAVGYFDNTANAIRLFITCEKPRFRSA